MFFIVPRWVWLQVRKRSSWLGNRIADMPTFRLLLDELSTTVQMAHVRASVQVACTPIASNTTI
jgi:hypothetical protein